ncbi:hypothetical protein SOMG_04055 [Schizosaccharomyces osmophilus]|uniref:Uncharacterized protein n=1 Tax=Schizosaccharomyces osmophilus TaxID=2545709 RepID=A0AAE9WCM3_9SCHI|nr:uncharacterized protein SOMG_04055 [Schizosaccharomyces osmophilus]WBW73942.1 hypothetical protein SOMG_04055 [Schizosaccharomyces osmophilus]
MNQDLFDNPFGIAPPSDDSYTALSKFTNEFAEAIPQDRFDSFRSKLASLHKAVTSKLEGGETFSQDNMSEIRKMFQLSDEKSNERINSLREDMIQESDTKFGILEGQLVVLENSFRVNTAQRSENIIHRVMANDTKPIPFVNGQERPARLPQFKAISDIDSLNPAI